MNDFEGLLSSDYGFKPQGKSAPMASSKPNKSSNSSYNIPFNFDIGGSKTPPSSSDSPLFDDHDTFFGPNRKSFPNEFSNFGGFNDMFSGGRPKSTAADFENIFGGRSGPSYSSVPVFDKPVFDDEDSSPAKYNDIFPSPSSAPSSAKKADAFDDLLGGIGRKETQPAWPKGANKGRASFDDLFPGFGGSSSTAASENRNSFDATKNTSHVTDHPFVVLESTSPPASLSSANFNDPLEEIHNVNNSNKKKVENTARGGVFDDIDPLESFGKSMPAFSADMYGRQKDESPLGAGAKTFETQMPGDGDVSWKSSVRSPERVSSKKMPVDDYQESPQSVFEMPSVSAGSHRSVRNASSSAYRSFGSKELNSHGHAPSDENIGSSDDVWLTVSEIPLFTQPTAAPPPSRPPPPRAARFSKAESRSFPASHAEKKGSKYSSSGASMPYFQSQKSESARTKGSFASPIDELEDFVMGRNRSDVDGSSDGPAGEAGEDFGTNSVAAAPMKEAMDNAEAKFRHVRDARERDDARASKSREAAQLEKEAGQDSQERKFKEHQDRVEQEWRQRERQEEERRQREEEERRCFEREQEKKEREKRRIERERELARQVVDRAAREARERAGAEARARAERAAVQKAQAEARQRAERAAVQRAKAEARERAAAEARERAEKATAEARERARAEAREKEARERTAAATAAAAGASQQNNEADLESFFSTGFHASSAPRPGASSSVSPTHFQSKPAAEATRTSVDSSSNMRKAPFSANIVDDMSSIFGGPPSFGEFQEVEGESEERRRARLERQQRTQERAAKALAEKNARDLEVLREQAERHRIAETLDAEIRRWTAGKEGNLRALLSTLQYVLWPECGWQPVSLTDMITAVAVKKVYRKATLCIHPDKVQQKGATLQQKYVAEKVFDILKEAWNKFNSEELF